MWAEKRTEKKPSARPGLQVRLAASSWPPAKDNFARAAKVARCRLAPRSSCTVACKAYKALRLPAALLHRSILLPTDASRRQKRGGSPCDVLELRERPHPLTLSICDLHIVHPAIVATVAAAAVPSRLHAAPTRHNLRLSTPSCQGF